MYSVYQYKKEDVKTYGEGSKIALSRELAYVGTERAARDLVDSINKDSGKYGAFYVKR